VMQPTVTGSSKSTDARLLQPGKPIRAEVGRCPEPMFGVPIAGLVDNF